MRPPRGLGLPRADRQRPNPAACLEPMSRWFEVGTFRRDVLGKTPNMFVVRRPYVNVSFTPPAAGINIHCNFRRNIAFGGILQNFRRNPTFGGISQKYAENVLLWRNNPTFKPRRLSFKYIRLVEISEKILQKFADVDVCKLLICSHLGVILAVCSWLQTMIF